MIRVRACILTLFVIGCSGGRSLVGTWEAKAPIMGQEATFRIVMAKDGKFVEDNWMYRADGMGFKFTATGTWKLNGDLYLQTAADINYEFKGPPELVSRATRNFQAAKAKQLQERNARPPMRVKWIDNDTYVVQEASANPITYRRIKP